MKGVLADLTGAPVKALVDSWFTATSRAVDTIALRKKPNLATDNIGNYRPVANVSFISKVVERVVADQFQVHLDETNALDPFQSSFRLHHGTETALVALLDDLLREADRSKMSLLVLLDISAAFDTVDHGILLRRLSKLGIGGLAFAWLQSFLGDRPQRVQLGERVNCQLFLFYLL